MLQKISVLPITNILYKLRLQWDSGEENGVSALLTTCKLWAECNNHYRKEAKMQKVVRLIFFVMANSAEIIK
jgi:hypothetical protein